MRPLEAAMRTTFNIDDDLLREARRLTGMTGLAALIHEGLRALIQRERARRLARLGATERSLRVTPRRRAPLGGKGK
jgi:Arc/MetJ family transcription regulator